MFEILKTVAVLILIVGLFASGVVDFKNQRDTTDPLIIIATLKFLALLAMVAFLNRSTHRVAWDSDISTVYEDVSEIEED